MLPSGEEAEEPIARTEKKSLLLGLSNVKVLGFKAKPNWVFEETQLVAVVGKLRLK